MWVIYKLAFVVCIAVVAVMMWDRECASNVNGRLG
jgi:hypothetical protein